MENKHIINCHIHTFNRESVPPRYPPYFRILRKYRLTRWLTRKLLRSLNIFERYANFIEIASYGSQERIFEKVRRRYPLSTQFIVLPMDMRGMGYGKPRQDINEQHVELKRLADRYPDQIIPFIHIDPRSGGPDLPGPDPLEFIRKFHKKGFRGIKLYPPLGYDAADELLMPIYGYANEHSLPVMVHCTRGGVRNREFRDGDVERTTAPHKYRSVLSEFPGMRLCLAHYGGSDDWDGYLKKGWLDDGAPLEKMDWMSQISTMIRSGDYPNLFTDISYTIFRYERYIPMLKVLLENEKIRGKVLFGSDYYMIEREKTSERELSMRLRSALGRDTFNLIAHRNPILYLKGRYDGWWETAPEGTVTISGKIKGRFLGLAEKDMEERKITGLLSPDGKEWSGTQMMNSGHTQGIACLGDWLVLTSNQRPGAGYIALCGRNSDGNYKYVSHVKDLDKRNTLYYHPGGIQMFSHNEQTWVVVPFEKGGDKAEGDAFKPSSPRFEESEIRFYFIKDGKLEFRKEITVKRKDRQAGSAGIARTNNSDEPFVLAVAYKKNTVDFYRGNMEKGFGTEPFSTLSASEESPSYVNAISLLPNGNGGCYLVGLAGKAFKRSDFVCAFDVDLTAKEAKIKDSLCVPLGLRFRSSSYGPSFRWGGSLSLQDGELSVVAAEKIINSEGETEIVVL